MATRKLPIRIPVVSKSSELPKTSLSGLSVPSDNSLVDDGILGKSGDSYNLVDSTGATTASYVKNDSDTWVKVSDNQRAATYVHGLFGNTQLSGGVTVQFKFSFQDGLFRDSLGNQKTVLGASNIVIDASVAGPIAGGRDRSGVFAVGPRDLYLYAIWGDGLAVSGTVSETGTPSNGGPVLPTGYTHWCFLTAMIWGTDFPTIHAQGSWVFYDQGQLFLVADNNTAETILSAPGAYPVITSQMQFLAEATMTTNAGGVAKENFIVRHVTGFDYMTLVVRPPLASTQAVNSTAFTIPNTTAQSTWHQWVNVNNVANVASRSANMWLLSYQVPNGS